VNKTLKRRSTNAHALLTPRFRKKVTRLRTMYTRKAKHKAWAS